MKSEELFKRMSESIIQGQEEEAIRLSEEAIELKMDLLETINKGFVPGIEEVGVLFEKGEYFLPQLLLSARAMKSALERLKPLIKKEGKGEKLVKGTILLGTVEGDIHEIGKNLVGSLLSANGFRVIDLGIDVSVEKFLEEVKRSKPDILGMSALLTTTMVNQRKVIEVLKSEGIRQEVKVIVGGAPVTGKWAEEIGADGYGKDAFEAVRIVSKLTA